MLPAHPVRAEARLGGEPVVLLGMGLAAASASDDPPPRSHEADSLLRGDRKESVVAKLGLLAVVAVPAGLDPFASGRLRKESS